MAAPCASIDGSPQSPRAICGEIQAVDFFEQTFTIEHPDGRQETIPFSRWTDFVRVTRAKTGQHRKALDPADLEIGDQVQVQLDPNLASAEQVQVLPPAEKRAVAGARRTLSSALE